VLKADRYNNINNIVIHKHYTSTCVPEFTVSIMTYGKLTSQHTFS